MEIKTEYNNLQISLTHIIHKESLKTYQMLNFLKEKINIWNTDGM